MNLKSNLIIAGLLLCCFCLAAQSGAVKDADLPVMKPGIDLSKRTAPAQSEYVVLVTAMKQKAVAQANAADKFKWDNFLASSKGSAPADMAMVIMMQGGPLWLSAYLATSYAVKAPADTITPNNLGVIFKQLKEYDASLKCLLYAEKLAPKSAVVQTNLGWTIAYMGDFKTAKVHFQKALAIINDYPGALEGMGILAYASGDWKTAVQYMFKRAKNFAGFSPKTAQILKQLDEISAKEKKEEIISGAAGEDDGRDDWKSDPLFVVRDAPEHPLTVSYPPEFINPVPADAGKNSGNAYQYGSQYQQKAQTAFSKMGRNWAALIKSQDAVKEGNTITIMRSNAMEYFYLKMLNEHFARRSSNMGLYGLAQSKKATDPRLKLAWMSYCKYTNIMVPASDKGNLANKLKEFGACGDNSDCRNAVEEKYCRLRTEAANEFLPKLYTQWTYDFAEDAAFMQAYYAASSPYIRAIHDAQLNELFNSAREANINGQYGADIVGWSQKCNVIVNGWSPNCETKTDASNPSVSQKPAHRGGKLQIFPEPYQQCHTPTFSYNFQFFGISADCDKISIKITTAALNGSLECKWGKDDASGRLFQSNDVITLRIGTGIDNSLDIGPGKLTAALNANAYFTFQGGKLIDNGIEENGKLTAATELKGVPESAKAWLPELSGNVSGSFRISAQSGISGDADAETEVGGKAADYTKEILNRINQAKGAKN